MKTEYQIKIKGEIDLSLLISLGAEPLGQVSQKDIYLSADSGKTWRIREENGQFIFAQKGHDVGQKARIKDVSEKPILEEEAKRLIKVHGVRAVVRKSRALYKHSDSVITLDEVDHLGAYVEIRSVSETNLLKVLKIFGFDTTDTIRKSYFDMMIEENFPKWKQAIFRFHEKVGELAFGITSGILTTIGVLVGVKSATSGALPVIASIAAIATADSLSDAFGMYMSKLGEQGSSKKDALRYALGTLAGKFLFPLTFIIPLLFCSLEVAVFIDIAWGFTALALLSIEQAIASQESSVRHILVNLGLATFIISVSTFVGTIVAKLSLSI